MSVNSILFCLVYLSLPTVDIAAVVFVKIKGTVVLNCSSDSGETVVWRHNKQVYSIGNTVNENFAKSGKFSIVGGHHNGEYNLRIADIGDSDEGTYWCVSSSGKEVTDVTFDVQIMTPPSHLTILNQTRNSIHAEEGRELHLSCTVESGIPPEKLYWYTGSKILVNGTRLITYSFIPEPSNHLQIYLCKAEHRALDKALVRSVQIILSRKPLVSLVARPSKNVFLGDNVTLLCRVDNPLDLVDIEWKKNNITLHYRSVEVRLCNVSSNDIGSYTCTAENKYGKGSGNIVLFVQEKNETTQSLVEVSGNLTSTAEGVPFQTQTLKYGIVGSGVIIFAIALVTFFVKYKFQPFCFPFQATFEPQHEMGSIHTDSLNDGYEEIDDNIGQMIPQNESTFSNSIEINHQQPDEQDSSSDREMSASLASRKTSSNSETSSSKSAEASVDRDGYLNPYYSLDDMDKVLNNAYDNTCTATEVARDPTLL